MKYDIKDCKRKWIVTLEVHYPWTIPNIRDSRHMVQKLVPTGARLSHFDPLGDDRFQYVFEIRKDSLTISSLERRLRRIDKIFKNCVSKQPYQNSLLDVDRSEGFPNLSSNAMVFLSKHPSEEAHVVMREAKQHYHEEIKALMREVSNDIEGKFVADYRHRIDRRYQLIDVIEAAQNGDLEAVKALIDKYCFE